jgi:eukaryotic-like serine/threonine-protein kinase
MDATRWERVEVVFHEARRLGGEARRRLLDGACAGDAALRTEVESLLAHEPESDRFLARPVLGHATRAPEAADPDLVPRPDPDLPPGTVVGAYRLLRRLGSGGMGIVYEAIDARLERRVALKMIRGDAADPSAHVRLVREARLAARVIDPRICQIYELGTHEGQPFLVMELVDGRSLADRLAEGRMPPDEALRIAVAILDGLAVLHAQGLVHRDLKPSNVYLAGTGVKLLDFGLARVVDAPADAAGQVVTGAGLFVGTPQYASPEQMRGEPVDATSDVFSAGVVIFEMLAGRPPFVGATLAALAHAVMFEAPPVLTGSPAVSAADRVLHRALSKRPADRYPAAAEFAAALRAAAMLAGGDPVVEARSILRLAVLPFRQLRPDAATAYLGPSLADALSGSLAGLQSLVVRSSLQSARYATAPVDLQRLASDLAVDAVLTGSLFVVRDRVRIHAEVVAVPGGDVWWTHTAEAAPDAVLDVHDDFAARVLAALPVGAGDKRRNVRATAQSAKAFDLYLRGLQLRGEAGVWRQALAYFTQALDTDPEFADAWAERGRLERILGKYEDARLLDDASRSLDAALRLAPEHGAAQCYAAQLDVDRGRVDMAIERLLERAWAQRAEPYVYAALVHACRYGGLLDASVAAHAAAVRLDPAVATSVLHTYYMQGAYDVALSQAHQSRDPLEARVLGALGRRDAAIAAAHAEAARFAAVPLLGAFSTGLAAALEGRTDAVRQTLARFEASPFTDGEGLFYVAEICAAAGLESQAFAMLRRAIDAGFRCGPAFETDPFLAPLRTRRAWAPLHAGLAGLQRAASEAFDRGRGHLLLGL